MVCRRYNRCSFGTLLTSTVVASVFTRQNKTTFTQTLIQVTFGAKSFTLIFPRDISPEGMLKGLNSMLPLDCEVIDCKIVSDWLSCPLYHPRQALYVSCQPFAQFYKSFQTFLHGTLQVSLDIKRIEGSHADVGQRNKHDFLGCKLPGKSN